MLEREVDFRERKVRAKFVCKYRFVFVWSNNSLRFSCAGGELLKVHLFIYYL